MESEEISGGSRTRLLIAFAAVYIVWGSTYLGIYFAIQTLPPFLMAGVRFLTAGGILYLWSRSRGAARPRLIHWRSAIVIGGLLLLLGNGLVAWAEQYVASGQAALLVATVPIWTVLVEWLRPNGARPSPTVLAGVGIGFIGLILLVGPGPDGAMHFGGMIALLVAPLSWTVGSFYARSAPLPNSAPLTTGIEMISGGALLLVVGLLRGELHSLDIAAVSTESALALLYLIVFGSLIGFSAYIYILTHASPTKVSTYAYVNPVVAVALGWALAGEELTMQMMVAAGIIVGSVVLLTLRVRPRSAPRPALPLGVRGRWRRPLGRSGDHTA